MVGEISLRVKFLSGKGHDNLRLNGRGLTNPGLLNFIDIALNADKLTLENTAHATQSEDTAFDAMSPWTRRASLSDEESPDPIMAIERLAGNLSPFPSEIIDVSRMGLDLSDAMKIGESSHITTPALGEVYWVGGFSALWIPFAFGFLATVLEKMLQRTPTLVGMCMRCICYVGFPVSLHQGLRAATRPFLYCFIVCILWSMLRRNLRRKGRTQMLYRFDTQKKLCFCYFRSRLSAGCRLRNTDELSTYRPDCAMCQYWQYEETSNRLDHGTTLVSMRKRLNQWRP